MAEYNNNVNFSLDVSLQEYPYLDGYKSNIRNQFSFIDNIQSQSEKCHQDAFYKHNLMCIRTASSDKYNSNHITCYKSNSNDIVTIIVTSVRRGDRLQPSHAALGLRTAIERY